jgi:hypothetical protein
MIISSVISITVACPCMVILNKVYTRDVWTDVLVATMNPSLACNSSPKNHTSGLVFHFYSSSSDECQLSLKLSAKKQTQVNQMVKIIYKKNDTRNKYKTIILCKSKGDDYKQREVQVTRNEPFKPYQLQTYLAENGKYPNIRIYL